MSENRKTTGAYVTGDTSSLEVIKEKAPHWIHHTKESEDYMGGVIYLPECECSRCGFVASREKERCPHCGSIMW